MYCPRCNAYSCNCMGGIMNQMAAQQQQGQLVQQQYMAYLQNQASRVMSEEMIKAYTAPKKNKKLLLIRK